jgi:hypothetical protein
VSANRSFWGVDHILRRVWVSDEYGPHIYRFAKNGHLIQVIQPPLAVLPHDAHGELNFTAETDPNTGRTPNQGAYPCPFPAPRSS